MFKNIQSRKITLKSKKQSKSVVLTFDQLPYLGIWQPKNAPFICIEPWHGIADLAGYTGEFKDKEMMIGLDVDQTFECNHTIELI